MAELPDVVVIDTCVLISSVLRRVLLRLAGENCFRPAWSPIIGDEWRRTAAHLWQASAPDLQVQWEALQTEFPDADQGDVSAFKGGLRRSDPKDWHVIAAARAAQARWPVASVAVLTRNIKDFNRTELHGLGLALYDPDKFLLQCWQNYPEAMQRALEAIPLDLLAVGREGEPIGETLKRERLFRLNKACTCSSLESSF
ncbi:PIN domain-containing protein [Paralcaligenes ureilyticus]|uniref:PIN domain-containing protein n=1 Tax=Paralcaligenes ureilyticus TaxID=627131 RepID=A0A4R3MAR3_9BURK|nr:PIN domain-containing protein [Paralcaligenes ureilyticus]TCT08515.1 PIN domain-containing protein [Paralcaligenes ureilyticus]